MSDIHVIKPDWSGKHGVLAYTTTRSGGVSKGNFESLNVGLHVGDNPHDVAVNRQKIPAAKGIHWLEQIHSSSVVTLPTNERTADAAISRTQGVFCAVMTADCVPILVCNHHATEVAAIHAGWKGLESGIIANTISGMQSPAAQLQAWIGPAISAQCYEVDRQLAQRFAEVPNAFRNTVPGKALLDLPWVASWQLKQLGVQNVEQSELCTYTDEERFFSHRRASHRGEKSTGRIVSVIGITKYD